MSLSCGFFNAVDGDPAYNADTMSEYFKGLVSNGVYADVGDGLQVVAGVGLTVNVKRGRCIIECKWAELDEPFAITLAAASPTLNRWTAIVARLDRERRLIEIVAKNGVPAANPAKPAMTRTSSVFELCLAYIYVARQATTITQTSITDTRADTNICGWVTGLIKQVDTSELFLQWQTAYEEFYDSFRSWFDTLTQSLQVNTYIERYEITRTGLPSAISEIDLNDIEDYTFDQHDIVSVFINGLRATPSEYTVRPSGVVVVGITGGSDPLNNVTVEVLKSKIGDPIGGGGSSFSAYEITERTASTSEITTTNTVSVRSGV